MASASETLASITSDSGNSASLASQALAAFQNVAAASNSASNAAADAAAAAERASSAAEAAVRAREEAAAAAALAARTSSGSSNSAPSASVTSAETRAAQEAANRARELERQAQEAARLAAEAKAAEEKAAAEKLAAEEAAAKAKAAADRAAAQAIAKEEAKRKAARNQIAKDKSTVKKIVEKIKDTAEKTDKSLNTSSKSINSAYESAISEAAKSNKALAALKKEENTALANLNLAKNELLALGKSLKIAADNQKEAIAAFGNAQYKVVQLENVIDATKTQLTKVESEIKGLEVNYKELTTKYDSLNKVAQSAISAAEASKKNAEMAYKALLQATNSNNLVAKDLDLELNSDQENFIPDSNATSALTKLKEAYQNAQNQANKDKVLADRAVKDAAAAREALLKAKQVFQSKQEERKSLKANLESLNSKLASAKTELKSASAAKVKAVDSFTKSANKLAVVTDSFREKELAYDSAKSNTKFEYENASSKNNQVLALKKLSDWSKTSVAAAKDAINAIDEEVRNLENSQALDLLNSDLKIGFISTSIPVFIFTVTAVAAIYAYLARRKRRSKFDLASDEVLAKIREQQVATAIKTKSVKVSKAKSLVAKKKPKSTKGKR
jgi:chromosome segregation ATPase